MRPVVKQFADKFIKRSSRINTDKSNAYTALMPYYTYVLSIINTNIAVIQALLIIKQSRIFLASKNRYFIAIGLTKLVLECNNHLSNAMIKSHMVSVCGALTNWLDQAVVEKLTINAVDVHWKHKE
ncbi:hypothetical protein [Bartonella sp. B1099]|uniref:hypothetical protein n=1 Tax=Bartonella sp. B1099 TaxID=2911422 RepID=UPI0020C352E9|nr:hypothetical protein [Bartonella sp. B1099]